MMSARLTASEIHSGDLCSNVSAFSDTAYDDTIYSDTPPTETLLTAYNDTFSLPQIVRLFLSHLCLQ